MRGVFFDRDQLYRVALQPPFDINITKYAWDVTGGPDFCEAEIVFPRSIQQSAIWEVVNYLRYGFKVYNDRGTAVWWGYLNELTVNDGFRSYGISLDNMYNNVKCTYELLVAGTGTGVRGDTAWYSDATSEATYGEKQKVYSMTSFSIAAAVADAQSRLARAKYPPSIADMTLRGDMTPSVNVVFRGWWSILNWLYYGNTSTAYSTVAEQLVTMAETSAFIASAAVVDPATTSITKFRNGDELLKDEIEKLMMVGGDNDRRILATIDQYQNAVFYTEPAYSWGDWHNKYYLDQSNNLCTCLMSKIDPTECKVGVWAYMKNFENSYIAREPMGSPSPIFIERAVYDVGTGTYSPESYGYRSPFEEIQGIER